MAALEAEVLAHISWLPQPQQLLLSRRRCTRGWRWGQCSHQGYSLLRLTVSHTEDPLRGEPQDSSSFGEQRRSHQKRHHHHATILSEGRARRCWPQSLVSDRPRPEQVVFLPGPQGLPEDVSTGQAFSCEICYETTKCPELKCQGCCAGYL